MKTTRWLALFTFAACLGAAAHAHAARPSTPGSRAEATPVAEPKGKTGIEWKVGPANVEIYLDGKKLGTAGELKFTEAKPGKHAVRLTKGGDETEMEVKVNKGEVLKFEFEFTDG